MTSSFKLQTRYVSKKDKSNEDLLYGSMKQAYQFFMDNDDESKDVVIQEIADEFSKNRIEG